MANKMNTVIVVDWWSRTAVVFFVDIDDFYMLDIGKNKTLRGVKSYIRREVSSRYDVKLSRMRFVKNVHSVTFLLAKRVEKEG